MEPKQAEEAGHALLSHHSHTAFGAEGVKSL